MKLLNSLFHWVVEDAPSRCFCWLGFTDQSLTRVGCSKQRNAFFNVTLSFHTCIHPASHPASRGNFFLSLHMRSDLSTNAMFFVLIKCQIKITLTSLIVHSYYRVANWLRVSLTQLRILTVWITIDCISMRLTWILLCLTVDVLPYKIGLASLGFVTALILVLIVCTKRKEVLESVKESCCKRRGWWHENIALCSAWYISDKVRTLI